MKVVIAGASGLTGRALVSALRGNGIAVQRLVRRRSTRTDEITWDPAARSVDPAAFADVDAVVNLAGENVGAGRWSKARREAILSSRVNTTRTLVDALARAADRRAVLVNASAVGCYGDCGDEVLTEERGFGRGFLADVCRVWEAEAERASSFGTRTILLRLGVVLAPDGGALAKLNPLFQVGLGGRLGSGDQWMSWIHRDDVLGVIQRVIGDETMSGSYNLVAPEPVTNRRFTEALGDVLRRPTLLPVPRWTLRLALGRMAEETVLASTRAVPVRLERAGYSFEFRTIEAALTDVLRGANPVRG